MDKNKNILIGGLLALVVIMAVGYAAFATTLNITSTSKISSTWNVGFDTSKTTDTTGVVTKTGTANGTVTYNGTQSATIDTTLNKPGDKVVYVLTVKNTGTIDANLAAPTISENTGGTCNNLVCTSTGGHIKVTVGNPASSSLVANTGTTTITVTAEFPDTTVSSLTETESMSITVNLNATQA